MGMELVYLVVGTILVLIAFSQGKSSGIKLGTAKGLVDGTSKERTKWTGLATEAKVNGEVWHDYTDPANPVEIYTWPLTP